MTDGFAADSVGKTFLAGVDNVLAPTALPPAALSAPAPGAGNDN